MKFVHAADIHLDSPLEGLARYEGAPVEEIRGATRRAFENLVDLCLTEEASLLLLAGDLYDGDWRDYNTGLFFIRQVARLTRQGIKVVWVRGNHDAASQITRSLRLPEGATELPSARPGTLAFEELGVAIHGQSYGRRDVADDLAAGYPDPLAGLCNVGLLHTALDGREGHDLYAPCSVQRLVSRGYQYWALGHVHRREVVSEEPWIVFPGNLQGRHARETGAKGATLVQVEDGAVVSLEHRALDVVRWSSLAVDASQAASPHDVVDLVRAALESELASIDGRSLAARIAVHGASQADAGLRAERERYRQEILAAALERGGPVWVEKVLFETRATADPDGLLDHDDPVAALLRSSRALRDEPEALRDLARELSALASRLPPEYRRRPDALDLEDPKTLAALLCDVERDLLPRLLPGREDT